METKEYEAKVLKIGCSTYVIVPNWISRKEVLDLTPGSLAKVTIQKIEKACLELISHDLNFFI